MFKIIELEIDPNMSGETGVFEVAWVEMPAIEQEMMIFSQQKFYQAPDYVSDYACRAIRENEKRGNPAGTQVGKVRAQQLCQKQDVSLETIKRMKSYLERAATYNSGNWDDNGTIAYGLWGGPLALTWVNKILRQEEDMAEVGPRGGIRESEKAPKSDTPNPDPKGEGTARGDASTTRGAEVSKRVEEILQKKSDDFNEKYKENLGYGTTVGMLKSVYQRGVGAYNTSHSPNVSSAEQWALARVNAFLYLVKNGRPENKNYDTDFDLLPSGHPKKDKMAKMDFAECPPATRSISINLKNRQKAIDVAKYGPLNPNQPNEKYWEAKAKQFNTTIEEAKSALCQNCAFFNVSPRIEECIAEGISDDPYDVIKAGQLGYCEAFDFKCAAKRTCDAWVVGGPVKEEKFVYPNPGETKDEFISRCVGVVIAEGKTQDQALGQCYGMWENREFAFDKVSFDWDDTLTTAAGKRAWEKELAMGNHLYIISARSSVSKEMLDFASKYSIPASKVYAVGSNIRKLEKIKDLGIKRHYDNNPVVKSGLPSVVVLFDYDVSAIGGYVDYPESGTTDSMLVEPTDFGCGCGLEKSNTYFEMEPLDVFGYITKHFEICPGAMELFMHLMQMNPDEETIGMIRSAAQIADNVFEIEKRVIERGYSQDEDLKQAMILVDDFKDLMHEIDEEVGMMHNTDFMDGHISIIRHYLDEDGPSNQELRKTMIELKKVDAQKFEAITNILLQGLNLEEVKQANFRDGQKLYRYSNFFPGVPDTRDFCGSIEEQFYRRSVIDLLRDTNIEFGHNRQPYSKWLYKGGPNCVHAWVEYEVRRRRGSGGDLITDVVLIGPVAGLPGTPPRNMPLQGYYSEETRAKSKRAYAIERSQQGFNATYMNENQVKKCFGDLCQIGFSKTKDQLFAAVDEKRMIYTPLMIPNILIPRIDEVTREKYYVKFTPETINKIAKKFAIEGRNRMTNYEHSDQKFQDIVMVESWIVEGENDKAYELGFTKEQIPVGTWMGGYYVLETPEGEDVWNNYVKNGKVRGASVEGNFILNFSALKDDEYLLGQIINILKNITE